MAQLEIEELRELSKTFDSFYVRGLVGVMENSIQVNEPDFTRLTSGMTISQKNFHGLQQVKCNMGGFYLTAIIQHKRRM